MNRIATIAVLTAVSAAALPVPLAGAKTDSGGFVQKVNGICGDTVTQIDNLPAASDGSVSAKTYKRGGEIFDRTAARLNKVHAPAYAAKRYHKMVGLLNTNYKLADTIVPQAKAGHTKAVEHALYTIVKNTFKFNDIAVDLNVGNCASITFPGYSDSAG
jgi:hypothetical protein